MQWLRRLFSASARPTTPADDAAGTHEFAIDPAVAADSAPGTDDEHEIDALVLDGELLVCASCGTPLGLDPEDDPEGEAGQPLCGECHRARHFDVLPGRR